MKAFGREKKIHRNLPDHHPHPKHIVKMWWEDMCDFLIENLDNLQMSYSEYYEKLKGGHNNG